MFLLLYPLSFYVFYFTLIGGAIIFPGFWMIFAGVFLFRSIIQIAVLQTAASKLDERDLGWKSTFFEILQGFFIHPAYFFATLFVKQRTWS
jgi:hypothetical protein